MSRVKSQTSAKTATYNAFQRINGDHPLKHSVDNIYVPYQAFVRAGGEVAYFNFELAKEMGLIPMSHPHSMNSTLSKTILDTFSLQIINEYDIQHKTKIDKKSIKANDYMATRYLQIQHPNKQGKTSGDGRSIWNGCFSGKNAQWDVSSCGTGATRLSPATSKEGKFFKTGSKMASYGCGRADFNEGMIAALFSDMMYHKNINTERTLAIIRFKNGNSVNVRASKNLLRPAHFFGFMKRGEYEPLKQIVDYYIQREISNGTLVQRKQKKDQYRDFLEKVTRDFSVASAKFESEYIFCWMDWDGDNILMDGGIIDYGTIRQFGLFHHEYRYDDVDKYSTTITEQKNKAKYTVQRFAQIVDFLLTGKKKNIKEFSNHSSLKSFDKQFHETLVQQVLSKIGFTEEQQQKLLKNKKARILAYEFQRQFRYYEKAVSGRRAYKTPDGVTRDAIFCMRDFLREFPIFYLQEQEFMSSEEFIVSIASNYSSYRDLQKYERKTVRNRNLQKAYIHLMEQCAELCDTDVEELLESIVERSSLINRYDILTGNGVIRVIDRLLKSRLGLNFSEFQGAIHQISMDQINDPDFVRPKTSSMYLSNKNTRQYAQRAGKLVSKYRESI